MILEAVGAIGVCILAVKTMERFDEAHLRIGKLERKVEKLEEKLEQTIRIIHHYDYSARNGSVPRTPNIINQR